MTVLKYFLIENGIRVFTIKIRAICATVIITKFTMKAISGILHSDKAIYEIGNIDNCMLPIIIWYRLILPVACTAVIKGFDMASIIEVHIINLANDVVCSGTSLSHQFRISFVSIKMGNEIKNSKKNEYLELA